MEIVKIDLVPSGVMPSCHASQYDIGREIRFLLTDGGEEYTLAGTETVSIELRKPDGTSETIAIENTSSNYVDWETSDGELDLSGVYLAEISIKSGDDVLGSANFIVKTEADAYDGAGVHVETVGPADICTFETTLPEPLQSVLVNVEATGGNGTPDNPIPINGYSSANITRCGVNLWDEEWEVGNIDGTGADSPANDRIRSKGYIQVKGTSAVYLVIPTAVVIHKYGIDKSYLGNNYVASSGVFSISSDVAFIRFRTDTSYGTTYDNDISINYPATDTAYHAYNGDTVTIAFGQTVYGGVLDVTRGKLTVTLLYKAYDGSEAWYTSGASGGEYRVSLAETLTNVKLPTDADTVLACLCNMFTGKTANQTYQRTEGISWQSGSGIRIYASNYNTSDITPWKTLLSNTPLQVVYELATPFDIDLTPEVISAIVGTNNVFADCGQTTVKYLKAGD